MKLEHKTKEFIVKHHMLFQGAGILIALSGGADSVALLEVLCSLRETMDLHLAALHIHHGMRAEAQADADFCRELCHNRGVAFFCEYGKVPELAGKWGMSLEEAGRKLRYQLFEQYRQRLELDMIAVAHHQNDQAETMLFQLFRGSGLRGLAGIPVQRDYIIRPLLGVTREEIEEYLAEKQVDYVTDATNLTDVYARNKLRLKVLPVAEEISAGAAEHMCRTGDQLREVLDYMEQEAQRFLEAHGELSAISPSGTLSVPSSKVKSDMIQRENTLQLRLPAEELKKKHPALQKMIILAAIEHTLYSRKDITARHVEAVLQLLDKDGEKTIHLPRGAQVRKRYECLIFSSDRQVFVEAHQSRQMTPFGKPIKIEPGSSLCLPDGRVLEVQQIFQNKLENIPKSDCIKWFDYDKINGYLVLRSREKGDFLTINDNGNRKSLQDYLVNEKIPKSERDKLLVLADGQHIIWVPGMRISSHYKVTQKTKRILQVYIGGEHHGRESGSID